MNFLKKLLPFAVSVCVLLSVVVFVPPQKAQAAIPTFEEAVIVSDGVNMRMRPTVDSPFVLKLLNGTRVGVFCEEVDGWYRVIYGNYRGYVSKEFVFLPSTDVLVGNVLEDDTPVYLNAGAFSEQVDTLNAGMGVTILSMQREHYYVEYMPGEMEVPSLPEEEQTAPPEEEAEAQPTATEEPAPAEETTVSYKATNGTVPGMMLLSNGGELSQEQPQQTAAPAELPPAEQTAASEPPEEEQSVALTPETEGSGAAGLKRGYITKDSVRTSASKNAMGMVREGMKGVEVAKLQRELQKRGFLADEVTGEFGSQTLEAVSKFQQFADLDADGVAGMKTLELLYGDNNIRCTYAQRMGLSDPVELIPWDEVSENYIPKEKIYTVMDIRTGITWKEYRFGGWFHSDTVPLTAEDTAKMKQAVGEWSWERRPIWVLVDGVNIAASMNAMPHLSNPIPENNFGGHHCIHFYKSKVHETSAVCPRHAAQVQYAYKMGQES